MTTIEGDSPLQVRVVASTTYVDLEPALDVVRETDDATLLPRILDDRHWYTVGTDDPLTEELVPRLTDPAALLDSMHGIYDVQDVGPEQLGDANVMHLRARIGRESAISGTLRADRSRLKRLFADTFGNEGDPDLDVWLDDANRVRHATFRFERTFDGFPYKEQIEMDLTEFGTRIEVRRPPADEIFEFDQLRDDRGLTDVV